MLKHIKCQNALFSDIQAVLFDKDGTLARTAPFLITLGHRRIDCICHHVPTVRNTLLISFGLNAHHLRSDGLLAVGTRYENEIAAAAAIATTGYGWADALAIAQTAFQQADQSLEPKAPQTPLFPGTIEFLKELHRQGLILGLLSADSSHHVHEFVQTYQLSTYFQFAMGIDRPPGKPDPRLIQIACEAMNVQAQHLLVIGDSRVDIQLADTGDTAGCIAMAWGAVDCEDSAKPEPGLEQAGAIARSFDDIAVF